MNFKIQVVPHDMQRYDTVGDYTQSNPLLIKILVSDMSDSITRANPMELTPEEVHLAEKYELLIAIHEMVESLLCYHNGINFQQIDVFDMEWNKKTPGFEPGDDVMAPYHKEHLIATAIEVYAARMMGVDWGSYSDAVDSLQQKKEAVEK